MCVCLSLSISTHAQILSISTRVTFSPKSMGFICVWVNSEPNAVEGVLNKTNLKIKFITTFGMRSLLLPLFLLGFLAFLASF